MSSLVRTRVGEFRLENAVNLEDAREDKLMAVDSVFANLPECKINAKQEKKCRNGCEFKLDIQDGRYRVYSEEGSFLMLGEAHGGVMKTVKSFFEVN